MPRKQGDVTCEGITSLSRDQRRVATIMHPGFKDAMTASLAELFNRQPLVVVTGAAGLGKSTLLLEIGRVLQAAGWHIATGLEFELKTAWNAKPKRPAPGPIVVLIDGPGQISAPQIQCLLRLKDLAIVIALPETPGLRFPTCAPVRLKPMNNDASAQYLAAWLLQTGTMPDLLTPAAMARVIELSQGIPRVLSSLLQDLADHADPSAKPLSEPEIDQVAQRLDPPISPRMALPALPQPWLSPEPDAQTSLGDPHAKHDVPFQPNPATPKARGLRHLIPTHPGSAALAGLLSGVAAAIIALLLQDLLPSPSDATAESRASRPPGAVDSTRQP